MDVSALVWALLTSSGQVEFLRGVFIPFNCRLVLAEKNRSSDYIVTEIFGSSGNELEIQRLRLEKDGELTIPKLYRNLRGEILNVSSIGKDSCKVPVAYKGIRSVVQCIHFRVWHIVVDMLNFTFQFVQDPQDEIPFQDRVKYFGVEVSFHNLVLLGHFLENHSFLWPTWQNTLEIFTAYLGQAFEWKTFIRPFKPEIWSSAGFIVLILATVAILVDRFRPFPERFDYAFLPMMAFCNQGVPKTPKKSNYRLLFLLAFAVPIVLVPAYSAVLTSFLTVHVHQMPFTDLEGFAAAKDYKIGGVGPFDFAYYLGQDRSPAAQKVLSDNLIPVSDMPRTEREGARRMCGEKFSFIYIPKSWMSLKPLCPFYKFDKPFLISISGMPIRKGSPFKRYIDHCLRAIRFSGVLEAIKDRETQYVTKMKESPEMEKETPITFQNMVLLFSLVLLGVIISSVILLLEIVTVRFLEQDMQRK